MDGDHAGEENAVNKEELMSEINDLFEAYQTLTQPPGIESSISWTSFVEGDQSSASDMLTDRQHSTANMDKEAEVTDKETEQEAATNASKSEQMYEDSLKQSNENIKKGTNAKYKLSSSTSSSVAADINMKEQKLTRNISRSRKLSQREQDKRLSVDASLLASGSSESVKNQSTATLKIHDYDPDRFKLDHKQLHLKSTRPEDAPSCSKSEIVDNETDVFINRFPLVVLTKLAPGITSVKLQSESKPTGKSTEKLNISLDTTGKTVKKSDGKKSAWYDEDASLSDISVSDISMSDSEELTIVNPSKVKSKVVESADSHSDLMAAVKSQNKDCNKDKFSSKEKNQKKSGTLMKGDSASSGGKECRKDEKSRSCKEKASGSGHNITESPVKEKAYTKKAACEKRKQDSEVRIYVAQTEDNVKKQQYRKDSVDSKVQSLSSDPAPEVKKNKSEEVVGKVKKERRNSEAGWYQVKTSQSDNQKLLKRQKESSDTDSTQTKKSRGEALDKIIPQPELLKEIGDKDKIAPKSNVKYQLSLNPITLFDLSNENFRKFINLASDCAVHFKKRASMSSPVNGHVDMFFGDTMSLQSAMQRLGQLPVLADNVWVKGTIRCFDLNLGKQNPKDVWKQSVSARLYFQFCAEKADRLRQLVSIKDRKKEGTKSACAQLHRIPSSISQEMLSLLFPFSIGVKISGTDPLKGLGGSVDVEFESQEWMEAVLVCFRDFAVLPRTMKAKTFRIYIKNYIPPLEKSLEKQSSTVTKQELQQWSTVGQDTQIQRGQGLTREGFKNYGTPSFRFDQRKRPFSEISTGAVRVEKQSRLENVGPANYIQRGSQETNTGNWVRNEQQPQQTTARANKEVLHQIALARGLDPNNPDVIRILEMTAQFETLQTLVQHKTAQATSLGITGYPVQQALINQNQSQERQQLLAMEHSREALRLQAARQVQTLQTMQQQQQQQAGRLFNAPQVLPLWPQIEQALLRQREEVRRKEEKWREEELRRRKDEERRKEERKREEEERRRETEKNQQEVYQMKQASRVSLRGELQGTCSPNTGFLLEPTQDRRGHMSGAGVYLKPVEGKGGPQTWTQGNSSTSGGGVPARGSERDLGGLLKGAAITGVDRYESQESWNERQLKDLPNRGSWIREASVAQQGRSADSGQYREFPTVSRGQGSKSCSETLARSRNSAEMSKGLLPIPDGGETMSQMQARERATSGNMTRISAGRMELTEEEAGEIAIETLERRGISLRHKKEDTDVKLQRGGVVKGNLHRGGANAITRAGLTRIGPNKGKGLLGEVPIDGTGKIMGRLLGQDAAQRSRVMSNKTSFESVNLQSGIFPQQSKGMIQGRSRGALRRGRGRGEQNTSLPLYDQWSEETKTASTEENCSVRAATREANHHSSLQEDFNYMQSQNYTEHTAHQMGLGQWQGHDRNLGEEDDFEAYSDHQWHEARPAQHLLGPSPLQGATRNPKEYFTSSCSEQPRWQEDPDKESLRQTLSFTEEFGEQEQEYSNEVYYEEDASLGWKHQAESQLSSDETSRAMQGLVSRGGVPLGRGDCLEVNAGSGKRMLGKVGSTPGRGRNLGNARVRGVPIRSGTGHTFSLARGTAEQKNMFKQQEMDYSTQLHEGYPQQEMDYSCYLQEEYSQATSRKSEVQDQPSEGSQDRRGPALPLPPPPMPTFLGMGGVNFY